MGEFFNMYGIDLDSLDYKIHTATATNHDGFEREPIIAYLKGDFKTWQEHQKKRNFQCEIILSLIKINKNQWIFVGFHRVLGFEENKENKIILYKTELTVLAEEMIGRLVINYEKTLRQNYLIGKNNQKYFHLSAILPQSISLRKFLELEGFQAIPRDP